MAVHAREYFPDPVPPYEPEYTRPADLSYLDNYKLPPGRRVTRLNAPQHLNAPQASSVSVVSRETKIQPAQQAGLSRARPLLRFPRTRASGKTKISEARAESSNPLACHDTPLFNEAVFNTAAYESGLDAPMSMMFLVRGGFGSPTVNDGRARLAYHVRGVEEACQILEEDASVGSWDIAPLECRLRELRRKFRKRERGEI